jgi:histidyl-tRNA synthetase
MAYYNKIVFTAYHQKLKAAGAIGYYEHLFGKDHGIVYLGRL